MIASTAQSSSNRVIKVCGISKGAVYYKKKGYPNNRKGTKTRDSKIIDAISSFCGKKPTYGTPRVRAIMQRDFNIKLTQYMTYQIMI